MTRGFEELPWHDAEILELAIDRRQPGDADEVLMVIAWPNGRRSSIRFLQCYALSATMNFGVVAAETVRSASERADDEELRQHRAKWARLGVDLSALKKFTLETNSTASTIVVFALRWEEQVC